MQGLAARLDRGIANGATVATAVCLVCNVLLVLANIVARDWLAKPIVWASEIEELLLYWIAFGGAVAAYHYNAYAPLTFLIGRLSPAWRAAMEAAVDWTVALASAITVALATHNLISDWIVRSDILQIPRSIAELPLSIGLTFLAILCVMRQAGRPLRAVAAGAAIAAGGTAVILAAGAFGTWAPGPALWLILAAMVVLLALSVPITFALLLAPFVYTYATKAAALNLIPAELNDSVGNVVLLAVPFFVLSGYLATGSLSAELSVLAEAVLGRIKGGALVVAVVTMYLFSGISGSKAGDMAAATPPVLDIVRRQRYSKAEGVAVIAASAAMGETIPPSIALLILGSLTSVSIAALFAAGVVPASLLAVVLIGLILLRSKPTTAEHPPREPWQRVLSKGIPALSVPLVLLVGLLTGIATPTEVSAVCVGYTMLLLVTVYRPVDLQRLWAALREAAVLSGAVLMMVATGTAFAHILTLGNVPAAVRDALQGLGAGGGVVFMIASVMALLVMGMLFEGLPALIIFGPILIPVGAGVGIDPIHYSIVIIMSIGIGAMTPPLGIGLYTACMVSEEPVEPVSRRVVPYLAALIVGTIVIALVPGFSLLLPHVLHLD